MIVEGWQTNKKIKLQLNKGSTIAEKVKKLSISEFESYLFNKILQGKIGYGGYLEERDFYERSEVFKNEDEFRSIHLGVDIWTCAEKAVYAPVDCEVHSFANNDNQNDYGATIILKGEWNNEIYHFLYGHLSLHSLNHIKKKTSYNKGEVIGWLGNKTENGGWPPHLHFQLIKNLQGKKGDYIGVCAKKDIDFYATNCPNPMQIINAFN